ncbi:hypothetical protein T4D_16091 [Trichinella pseudospiralis]|uniref:Uncharacterized protein n=1 Tax=Trichinella pseudospiralis TaxID=6337 RepID=A0A0V1FR75_TRIPS|nr:hypothetical protein T4D_16091 [Trichinella pseudospiralis]
MGRAEPQKKITSMIERHTVIDQTDRNERLHDIIAVQEEEEEEQQQQQQQQQHEEEEEEEMRNQAMLIRPTKCICCFLLFDWLINFETAVLYSVPTLIIIFHHWLSFDKLLSLSRLAAATRASRPDSSLKARLSSKIIDIAEQQFVAFQATFYTTNSSSINIHTEADEKQRSEEIITSQPLAKRLYYNAKYLLIR